MTAAGVWVGVRVGVQSVRGEEWGWGNAGRRRKGRVCVLNQSAAFLTACNAAGRSSTCAAHALVSNVVLGDGCLHHVAAAVADVQASGGVWVGHDLSVLDEQRTGQTCQADRRRWQGVRTLAHTYTKVEGRSGEIESSGGSSSSSDVQVTVAVVVTTAVATVDAAVLRGIAE